MKTIDKNNRNQFGSKFDERTIVSLVFCSWLKLIVFVWPELKTQAKSLFDFFQISLFDFFCGLCPLDFFCVSDQKTNCGGHKPNTTDGPRA